MGLILEKAKTGFLNPANAKVDNLISASNGLMCLANGIFGAASLLNPSVLLGGLASVASSMISAITQSVTAVIQNRVNQMIDSVLSPIRMIEGIIANLTSALIEIQNDIESTVINVQMLLDKALNMDNYFKDKQNCSQMAADLLNCLAQSAIDQVTNKVAMNVDKHLGKIADSVSQKALSVNGVIASKVERHTQFLNKATMQTKLLT